MRNFLIRLKEAGLSLIEVLILSGIVAGISLSVAKLGQESSKFTKTSETNTEINNFVSNVSFLLSNRESCNATLGVNSTIGTPITAIRKVDSSGTKTVYTAGNALYGNNTFSILSMTTASSPVGSGLIDLKINIQRKNSQSLSSKEITKNIPLFVIFDGSGRIESCYSDVESIISTVAEAACQGNGGARWDSSRRECVHDVDPLACPQGQVLRSIVATDGTTSSECVDLFPANSPCGEGEYISSISASGAITCAALVPTNPTACAQGQYARTISNGSLVCESFPNCLQNQFLSTDGTGRFICKVVGNNCGPNQYFEGIDLSGNSVCRNFPSQVCGPGQYVKEIDANGNSICGKVPNHLHLNPSDFEFVDGFNEATNQWNRKSINQTAERICSYFEGMSWSGTRCLETTIPPTPVNGGWSSWGPAGSCVDGLAPQTRSCTNPPPSNGGTNCSGPDTQYVSCSTPVNGGWSSWVNGPCVSNSMTQTRTCTNPAPANGGATCSGPSSQTVSCSSPVDGGWSNWSPWSLCSSGSQTRTRTCTNPAPSNGGENCVGNASETQSCSTPVNGGWSAWGAWSGCPRDGGPPEKRTRTCTAPAPANGGAPCSGLSEETRSCNRCDDVRSRWLADGSYTSTLYCCPSNMFSVYTGGDCEERVGGLDDGEQLWRCPSSGGDVGNIGDYCY